MADNVGTETPRQIPIDASNISIKNACRAYGQLTSSRILAALLLPSLLFGSIATATNDMRPLGLVLLSEACAFQDPVYRDGLFAKTLGRSWTTETWEQSDKGKFPQCLRKKQWIPKTLCESVNTLNIEDEDALNIWFYDNGPEAERIASVVDILSAVTSGQKSVATPENDWCPNLEFPPARGRSPDALRRVIDASAEWAGTYEGSYSNPTFLRKTDRILAARGRHFGLSFNVHTEPKTAKGLIRLKYEIVYPKPGLLRPSGERMERDVDSVDCFLGSACLVGYVFASSEEVLPGEWRFILSYRGKVLLEHTFTVVDDSANAVARLQL